MKRACILLFAALPLFAIEPEAIRKVDEVLAKHLKSNEPGCAIGISSNGEVLQRAVGMADLEHDIPLTPDSIFESGSVAKQFTAAAVVLLARDGKLSLDDPIRKHLPRLPAAYDGITIRQMLGHTSGIRDWGTLMGLQGWPRGTRQDNQTHVLDILSRQRGLNYKPGSEWSYSNSNYNLAAMIVERVSGKSFGTFVQERIFTPMAMPHSSIRENWRTPVKGRAAAYEPADKGGWSTDIHFENIYGNCCVLTTVGDLLHWNEQIHTSFPEIEVPTKLDDGKPTGYALGLFLGDARGTPELYHGGATAGWRAFLTRFPEKKLSIALLCNKGDVALGPIVREIADVFIDKAPAPKKGQWDAKYAGLYRDPRTNAILRFFVNKDGELRGGYSANGGAIDPDVAHFDGDHVRLTTPAGYDATYNRVAEWKPTTEELEKLAGKYRSDEIGTTYELRVKDGSLMVHLDPDENDDALTPTFAKAFRIGSSTLITFTGDGFDVKSDFGMASGTARLERLHFTRVR